MPVRNAAAHLRAAVDAVLAQSYPRRFDVVLAVGPSHDDSAVVAAAVAAGDDRVRVVDSPSGATPAALNAAIAASDGEVVVRVDSQAVLAPGYIERAVALLGETGADNVGGVQDAAGTTPFEQAVAAAMASPFGVGGARFHRGGPPGPVDTVYLGVFRRSALERVGGFDETLLRNQDYELNYRLRASGGTVYFHPDLRVRYRPRGNLRALASQYYDYGRYKRAVVRRHPGSLRPRQAVPPLALIGNLCGVLVGLLTRARWPLIVPAGYAAALGAATAAAARSVPPAAAWRLPLVFATMHAAWGAGFLVGLPASSPASGFQAGPAGQ